MSKGKKFAEALSKMNWTAEDKLQAYHDFHESNYKSKENESFWKKKIKAFLDNWKNRKGFLNKKDAYFNFHEWHALGLGALIMDLYFRLDQGILLALWIAAIAKVWNHDKGRRDCDSHRNYLLEELGNNVHYWVLGGAIVAVLWVEVTGASPPAVDQGILSLVVSAFLGL